MLLMMLMMMMGMAGFTESLNNTINYLVLVDGATKRHACSLLNTQR